HDHRGTDRLHVRSRARARHPRRRPRPHHAARRHGRHRVRAGRLRVGRERPGHDRRGPRGDRVLTTILLPPTETKRAGGSGEPLSHDGLALGALRSRREAVVASVQALAADPDRAAKVLKLSERQRPAAIADNASLETAPTMPAIDRYTGVLYD